MKIFGVCTQNVHVVKSNLVSRGRTTTTQQQQFVAVDYEVSPQVKKGPGKVTQVDQHSRTTKKVEFVCLLPNGSY